MRILARQRSALEGSLEARASSNRRLSSNTASTWRQLALSSFQACNVGSPDIGAMLRRLERVPERCLVISKQSYETCRESRGSKAIPSNETTTPEESCSRLLEAPNYSRVRASFGSQACGERQPRRQQPDTLLLNFVHSLFPSCIRLLFPLPRWLLPE